MSNVKRRVLLLSAVAVLICSVSIICITVFGSASRRVSADTAPQTVADTGTDASLSGTLGDVVVREEKYSYAAFEPRTDASGRELVPVSRYDFESGADSYGFVYNYDWAVYTYALDYMKVREADNTLYRLRTCGGGYDPRIYAYAANGMDISSSSYVSMYVDFTHLHDSSDSEIGFYIYLSSQKKLNDQSSSSSAPLFLTDGECGYCYNVTEGTWKSAVIKDGRISVGADFCGYVMFPVSAFEHVEESGRKYVSTAKDAAGLFAAGYKYLCRVWTFTDVADRGESHSPIYFDNLTFYTSGGSHAHSYEFSERVDAGCGIRGYDVYTCSGCSEMKMQNITEPTEHDYTEYRLAQDKTPYRGCRHCGYIDTSCTSADNAPEGKETLFTVTFDFGRAGGKTERKFLSGDVIRYEDIPVLDSYVDRYTYQFNAWTSDPALITPTDPEGMKVERDMTFYARYLISDYANKYIGAISVLAFNGGPYVWEAGKTVVLGNSNMSLYHDLERDFASSGIPAYNNSVSGSTSYEMLEWYRILVLTYRPRAIVLNVTTNDMAYYNLSEKQILENMVAMYELTREHLPSAQIFFVSGNPLPGRTEYTQTIVRVNNAMYRFTLTHEGCEFVDVYPKVLAYANKYPTGWDTWTHLKAAGLADMFSDIKTAILNWAKRTGTSLA